MVGPPQFRARPDKETTENIPTYIVPVLGSEVTASEQLYSCHFNFDARAFVPSHFQSDSLIFYY
jgi:hypothetical protein